jgi:hypothetical protein
LSKKHDAERAARVNDPEMRELLQLMRRLADEQCGPNASFEERSAAMRRLAAAAWPEVFEGDDDGHEREDPKR